MKYLLILLFLSGCVEPLRVAECFKAGDHIAYMVLRVGKYNSMKVMDQFGKVRRWDDDTGGTNRADCLDTFEGKMK